MSRACLSFGHATVRFHHEMRRGSLKFSAEERGELTNCHEADFIAEGREGGEFKTSRDKWPARDDSIFVMSITRLSPVQ